MLLEFLRFELRFWLRGMMLWVFFFIIGTLVFAATSSDKITVGGSLENTFRNAPYVIQNFYSIMGVFTLMMTTAFVNSAAGRDFAYGTQQMIFSTPITKRDYLFGRFLGSVLVAVIPMLGISAGILLSALMPWNDAERWGPIVFAAHWKSILMFAIPNTLFCGAFVFTIAVLTRSTVTSFLGSLFLLTGFVVSEILTENLDNETIAALIDPFGARTFGLMTKYWTVADRNSMTVGWDGMLVWNRLLWLSVGAALFAFAYWRFSFSERVKAGASPTVDSTSTPAPIALPTVQFLHGGTAAWAQFLGLLRFEFWGLVKTTSFIVLLVAALLNTIPSLIFSTSEGYGNTFLPVTYRIVETLQGALYLFLLAMITYYAGVLIWKERDARMDEITDVAPFSSALAYGAKFLALMGVIALIQLVMLGVGASFQSFQGYSRHQLGLFFSELFVYDFSLFVLQAVLAFFVHVLSPNKYVGYFGYLIFLVANTFVWLPLNIATRLVRYSSRPPYTYSDFYGYGPFLANWWSFTGYWLLIAAVLILLSVTLWPRGKETRLVKRFGLFRGALRSATLVIAGAAVAWGGWLYYNTAVLNPLLGPETRLDRQAEYERTYKQFEKLPQPRITSIRYEIDIFPERRGLVLKGDQEIVNPHSLPINSLHLIVDRDYSNEVQIDGATMEKDDPRLSYRIYKLSPPMQPDEKRRMKFTTSFAPKGIQNSTPVVEVTPNGTFFNNSITPQIGYQAGGEISQRNDRKKRGLPERELMPALERNCTANCANTYLSNNSDWVNVETVISTAADQIAIAPGTLEKEWEKDGRRYFQYRLDHESMNFYSFMSARYAVAREEWHGIRTEVYYYPEHSWNVAKMMKSIQKSLDYYTKNFGPYMHKQARIIEFPRVASFAQAFPGTMPYSESIGFIAKMEKPDDIDMVYYVVAHEMGHQWWAHQVVGANMQGATLLSETLAQYSALMVMEKEYGRDTMRKFLEYEADRYLSARGRELLKERPMLTVEASQGYIHYRKGSVVVYHLKEMIGEEAINRALRKVIAQYAYKPAPYPTSHALVDALREETPAELRPLIQDLFEDITLFANRTTAATAKRRADGKFDITISVEARKYKADEKGNEVEKPVADQIEIGAFAKPEGGQRYGRTLHRERVALKSGAAQFTFTVDEVPEKAGIDPFRLLIDRVPGDNMKSVTVL
ncbi:MAG: M1 family aminopeptidase [Acidobacteria bacterium]|nr:M1 family aminopeptidase [Acidobacteriota bacterium]